MASPYDQLLRNWAKLYLHQTDPESAIEPAIASLGTRYRSQHFMPEAGGIIPDFVLLDEKLVIEIDGASHRTTVQKIKDAARTVRLGKLGYTVVRITNEKALAAPSAALREALAGFPHLQDRLDAQSTGASSGPQTPADKGPQPDTSVPGRGAQTQD